MPKEVAHKTPSIGGKRHTSPAKASKQAVPKRRKKNRRQFVAVEPLFRQDVTKRRKEDRRVDAIEPSDEEEEEQQAKCHPEIEAFLMRIGLKPYIAACAAKVCLCVCSLMLCVYLLTRFLYMYRKSHPSG
jgi:hypothetical protein